MIRHRQFPIAAFSLIELIVIMVVLVLLMFVVLPNFIQARQKARRITCVSHLKQIGLSFRIWGGDNSERYPMALSMTNAYGGTLEFSNDVWRTFQVLSNELAIPLLAACPSDVRQPATDFLSLANTNISYFIGLDADVSSPQLLLAGDRCLRTRRTTFNKVLTIQTNDTASWFGKTHQGGGNIALSDGSVQQFGDASLQKAVTTALRSNWVDHTNATLRLAMPE